MSCNASNIMGGVVDVVGWVVCVVEKVEGDPMTMWKMATIILLQSDYRTLAPLFSCSSIMHMHILCSFYLSYMWTNSSPFILSNFFPLTPIYQMVLFSCIIMGTLWSNLSSVWSHPCMNRNFFGSNNKNHSLCWNEFLMHILTMNHIILSGHFTFPFE